MTHYTNDFYIVNQIKWKFAFIATPFLANLLPQNCACDRTAMCTILRWLVHLNLHEDKVKFWLNLNYNWKVLSEIGPCLNLSLQYDAVKTQSIFSQILTKDTPKLAGEAEIWGVLCESKDLLGNVLMSSQCCMSYCDNMNCVIAALDYLTVL